MNKNATRHTIVATAVLTTVLALAGCSAGGSNTATTDAAGKPAAPASQTHAQACTIVEDGFKKVADLQGEVSSVMGDPSKASALLDKLDDQVKAIDDKVSNADVKKATADAASAIDDYALYIKKAISDPASIDVTQVQTKAQELGTKFTAVQKECS
jgi:predicted transglutaminase-like cysteine proteinase